MADSPSGYWRLDDPGTTVADIGTGAGVSSQTRPYPPSGTTLPTGNSARTLVAAGIDFTQVSGCAELIGYGASGDPFAGNANTGVMVVWCSTTHNLYLISGDSTYSYIPSENVQGDTNDSIWVTYDGSLTTFYLAVGSSPAVQQGSTQHFTAGSAFNTAAVTDIYNSVVHWNVRPNAARRAVYASSLTAEQIQEDQSGWTPQATPPITNQVPGLITDGDSAMGFGGYVTVPDSPAVSPTAAYTLEAWIKPSSVTSPMGIIEHYGTQSNPVFG